MPPKNCEKLKKVILKKKLKSERSELLAKLKKYQLKPEELEQLHSTTSMQTKGIKKFRKDESKAYVLVNRDPFIQESRLRLPIIGEEQAFIENVRYNDVVIVSGETGSGKTTQIPQFLYEAGYTRNGKIIAITEPRRVAAVSMSERVASELNLSSDEVSYQIRFSGSVSDKTCIKFMTDGVLLRECQQDFLLSRYSIVIIDEAHERSVFSDILIGLLSRIVPMRAKRGDPLKLIIMSATLRVNDFTENKKLFPKTPPVMVIEARQFPVNVHFAKRTPESRQCIQATYKKICSVHSKMPKGGILVFVTSQMEVKLLCSKLRDRFCRNEGVYSISDDDSDEDGIITTNSPLHCLPLYAMLPIEKQKLVFKQPPDGSRLCVIATNVAETSITIPNIRYVIDTGLEKKKIYENGVSRFVTTWTSKSSAEQRKGRAGRTGPGHCFRLYSSAVYTNDMPDHAQPHILQKPVEDVLLQMKIMNIDNVVNFPFPTRPTLEALMEAEDRLIMLGALEDRKTHYCSKPTALGKAMSFFALSPRCSKMLVLAPEDVLPYVVCLVSAITVREMFVEGEQYREVRRRWASHGEFKLLGDFGVMIRAAQYFKSDDCLEKGLRTKAMLEICKLRDKLVHDINGNPTYPSVDCVGLKKPDGRQSRLLRQILLSSYCDHVARRGYIDPNNQDKKFKNAYTCAEVEGPVYISPESVLRGESHQFVIYKEIYRTAKKTYLRNVAAIQIDWLSQPQAITLASPVQFQQNTCAYRN